VIEAEQSVLIDATLESVWSYVQDIRRWAMLFPGCRECTVINALDSYWILKVGAGGLVRTVNVLVHIDLWDGPGRVDFSYKLEGDPVEGGGSYTATQKTDRHTEVTMTVRVVGSGPMAPLWEALSRPLLPQLAKTFAGQLKTEIEKAAGAHLLQDAVEADSAPWFATFGKRLGNVWRKIFRRARSDIANRL
jgi:carbon monoxide dehydrogenase subunit G